MNTAQAVARYLAEAGVRRAFGVPGRFLLTLDHVLFDDEVGSLRRRLIGRGLRSKVEERLDALAGFAVPAAPAS